MPLERDVLAVDLLADIADLEHAMRGARIRSGLAAARRPLDAAHARAVSVETRRQAAAMREASKAGASYRAIAAEFGVSKNTVMRLLRRIESDPSCDPEPPPKPRRKRLSFEFPLEAFEALQSEEESAAPEPRQAPRLARWLKQ